LNDIIFKALISSETAEVKLPNPDLLLTGSKQHREDIIEKNPGGNLNENKETKKSDSRQKF